VLFYLIAFYGSGRLDGAAEQEEFFCEGRFTRIGVGYDGKRLAFADLVVIFHYDWPSADLRSLEVRKGTKITG
jgi:hypothetical protein